MKLSYLLLLLTIIKNSQSSQPEQVAIRYTVFQQTKPGVVLVRGIGNIDITTGEIKK